MRDGTPITQVQAEYALPDVISDESGDLQRFYVPSRRPPWEWPAEAARTFYYLDRDLAVKFVRGKAVSATSIGKELRESTLEPLVRRAGVEGLLAVFGPRGVRLESYPLSIDLDGDGTPERLVLLADPRRGVKMPGRADDLRKGATVTGFALFDGLRPEVVVFYQYYDYDGFQLRLDEIEGRTMLVSDGGRDHAQRVWGWWRHEEWPPDEWAARERQWDEGVQQYGRWRAADRVQVVEGK